MFSILAGVLGGLGLFLFGMNMMGNGLQKAAGNRLKQMIGALTTNKYIGVVVGAVVTMLIQSSSATTVMVVGFVNAGLMSLYQAIGVIMGANIGTTITAQLVAFKLTDIAPFVIAIGVAMQLASKKRQNQEIAEVLIGFGILFLGMATMSSVLKPLSSTPAFTQMITSLSNPFMGILVGFVITAIVQSSSATTGILLAVASTGVLGLDAAFPILFGQNIGTTVTAMISSVGASRTARRAALMHLLFNIIGTILFMVLLYVLPITEWITSLSVGDVQRQIANAHTLFNVANTLLLLPFSVLFVKAAERLIPIRDDEYQFKTVKYLDRRIIEETPEIALGLAGKEVLRMGKIVRDNLGLSVEAVQEANAEKISLVLENEKTINNLNHDITTYLIDLSRQSVSDQSQIRIQALMNAITDIERVGDHAENIAELAQYRIDYEVNFSESAQKELKHIYDMVFMTYRTSLDAIKTVDRSLMEQVEIVEAQVDQLEKEYRKAHISRLNKGTCEPRAGIIFLEIISNLERVSDHAMNIASLVDDNEHTVA
ncbi:Na/Pi cotransporter family protein [Gottschalkiaceae bacterium SANA]|nr:Na/Pi cotransporter family protein [Gottschalkiaceae bacterium SANA]